MIGRSLTRRLEHLETEFLPVAGETKIIRVDFVERDGKVSDHKDFTINLSVRIPSEPALGGGNS